MEGILQHSVKVQQEQLNVLGFLTAFMGLHIQVPNHHLYAFPEDRATNFLQTCWGVILQSARQSRVKMDSG